MSYRRVKIHRGPGGWGGPIVVEPTETRNKIVYITGGAKPEVAVRIAELTGCELVDGFKYGVKDSEIACAVINCGGTLRCGIYPQKRIPTVNIMATGKSGPLAMFIKEDIYVSAVRPENIEVLD
ncbi:PTS system glucitol/sorbitol-specific IIB component [Fonticella tunisiensis]|uniref:PTS system glucitol/sorbitol-specific IIB component n=1 Tax=Fonticella tunisiensis TaxID=1096341 RepID=A0A4R7KAL6_9CLOT|nr:PTS system glucitol/sorbitol-specific IIB component [Fonticella tunisiensis]